MRALRTALVLSLAMGCAALGLGCDGPPLDSLRRNGGAAPDPTGLIRGGVVYAGRRPTCEHTADGEPSRVVGNVILLLFQYDNPPPPTGSATSAANLLALSGRRLFSVSDCMPLEPTAEDLEPITREIDFAWPEIVLATGPADADGDLPTADYQIRGFYDDDGDFNPFFSIRNLATAGDVGGGAVVDPTAAIPEFRRLSFGHVDEHPLGQALDSVTVTLGAPIATERPMFEITAGNALSSEATIPLVADTFAREEALFDLTGMHVALIPDGAHTDAGRPFAPALAAAGIDFDFRPLHHGLAITPVDANGDGVGDPHPILGSNGVNWYTPIILLRRARSPFEVLAGVPDVLFIATVRPTFVLGADQGFVGRRTVRGADVIVPPIAVMVTNPAFPTFCRVPMLAPGNVAELYESQPVVDCQELPSGNYDVNVLSGLAGAVPHDVAAECQVECEAGGTDAATCTASCATLAALETETGVVFEGGSYSSQAWSIPNDLGCPDVAYDTTPINQLDPPHEDGTFLECSDPGSVLLPHQGRLGGMSIVEPDDTNEPDETVTTDGHGVASCETALHASTLMPGPVDYMPYPELFVERCCGPVVPFCGLPLCEARTSADVAGYPEAVRGGGTDGTVVATREMRVPDVDFTMNADGTLTPLCTPFLPPAQCCASASP